MTTAGPRPRYPDLPGAGTRSGRAPGPLPPASPAGDCSCPPGAEGPLHAATTASARTVRTPADRPDRRGPARSRAGPGAGRARPEPVLYLRPVAARRGRESSTGTAGSEFWVGRRPYLAEREPGAPASAASTWTTSTRCRPAATRRSRRRTGPSPLGVETGEGRVGGGPAPAGLFDHTTTVSRTSYAPCPRAGPSAGRARARRCFRAARPRRGNGTGYETIAASGATAAHARTATTGGSTRGTCCSWTRAWSSATLAPSDITCSPLRPLRSRGGRVRVMSAV